LQVREVVDKTGLPIGVCDREGKVGFVSLLIELVCGSFQTGRNIRGIGVV
jgi:hypothetical protein